MTIALQDSWEKSAHPKLEKHAANKKPTAKDVDGGSIRKQEREGSPEGFTGVEDI